MLALLGMIPGIGSLIEGILGKLFDMKVRLVQARVGADRDTAVELVKATAQAEHETTAKLGILASNKLLTLLVVGFATPLVIYVWKIVVVDKIIGPGCLWEQSLCWTANTDPIRGQVADWATVIIGSLFGSTTAVAVGKMWFGRDKSGE